MNPMNPWKIERLFNSEQDSINFLSRQLVLTLAVISLAIPAVFLAPVVLTTLNTGNVIGLILTLIAFSVNVAVVVGVIRGYVYAGILGLMGVYLFITLSSSTIYVALIAGLTVVTGAALFRSSMLYVVTTYIVLVRLAVHVVNVALDPATGLVGTNSTTFQSAIIFFTLAMISMIIRLVVVNVRRTSNDERRSNDLLQAGAEIGQTASVMATLEQLLPEVARLLETRFGLLLVRIYLLDAASSQLRLAASGGRSAEPELPITMGALNAVGQAALRGRIAITRATDATGSREGWLPTTKSQVAVPLLDGVQVMGVLEAQSERVDAFSAQELQALQIVATQTTTAIRNARLLMEQARVAEQNQALYAAAQENLQEIERLNRQLTSSAWQTYMERAEQEAQQMGVTLDGDMVLKETGWSLSLAQAGTGREPVRTAGKRPLVAVPLMLRGEVIGAIEVEAREDAPAVEVLELTQAVGEQLALSLENARLYEETGYAAAHQERINAIAARLQQTNSVDDLLRITLTELSAALGAQAGAVRLTRVRDDKDVNGSDGG